MPPTKPRKRIDRFNLHWLTALLGLVLLVVGQLQIAGEYPPPGEPTALGEWLNQHLFLNMPSIDNVVRGLPILLIGIILLFISLRGLRLLPREGQFTAHIPFAPGFLRASWPWMLAGLAIFGLLLWQLKSLTYQGYMAAQWVIVIVIFAIVAGIWDRRRQINLSPTISRSDILWMTGLLMVGIIVGAYNLQGLPDTLMGDEGSFWTAARDIANGEFAPPIFANGVYTFPILSSIGQAWALELFGINLWGWRFGSVLSGVITIIPLYLLARDAFDRKVAIASCAALIFSPYFLAFARLGYNNVQSLFITTLALYFLYLGLQRSSNFYLFLAGCAAGLGFYTYFAARSALLIAILFIGFLWIGRKIKFRAAVHAGILLSLGAILVIAPYLLYCSSQDAQGMSFKAFESVFFNTFNGRQFYSDVELFSVAPPFELGGNELFYNPKIYLVLITRGFIRTLLIFQKAWLISEHFIAFPLTGTVGVIFYLIGFVAVLKTARQPRSLLLLLWFFVTVFGLSALNTVPPRHTHMVSIIPALALLTGAGLNLLTSAAAAVHENWAKLKPVFLSLFTAVVVLGGVSDYFILMPAEYHPPSDQVMSWAGLYAQDESIVYVYPDEAEPVRPYIITEFRKDVPFEAIPVSDILSGERTFAGSPDTLIFYLPELADTVEPALVTQWGNDLLKRRFYNPDGIPVLAAGMNTPFVFVRDRGFLDVFTESYGRTSLLVLLGLLLGFLALTILVPASWTSRLPSQLTRLASWFNGPARCVEAEEEPVETWEQAAGPPPEAEAVEPPEWAETVFEPSPWTKAGRFKINVKTVPARAGLQGKDFYVKIHFPAVKLPQVGLPENLTVTLPSLQVPGAALLIGSVVLAILAQALVYSQNYVAGAALYLASAAGLFAWGRMNPKWKNVFSNQVRISPKAELWIALALLVVITFFHFYDLGYRVYGLEADETKWTAQSWFSTILRVDRGDFATAHYRYVPVDFWVRSIFLRIFGLNFISARIESAFISLVSVTFLYLLVRKLTASPPTAFLSALLYSFSFIELNASHQALHDTPLGIWIMGGLYFLAAGLKDRKWWQFQLSGIFLALGILTYDTFFPTAIFALAVLLGTAGYQTFKKQVSPKKWLQNIALTLWPILLAYLLFTQEYIGGRQLYYFSLLRKSIAGPIDLGVPILFLWNNLRDLLSTIFTSVVWQDSLLRWDGPLINPILLPFIIIGMVYNLWNIRRPYYLFLPIWFLSQVIPPIVMGTVWPRVFFTCVPSLIIWGAMGLWVELAAFRTWAKGMRFKPVMPLFILLVIAIIANDYYIFTSGINDPLDRVKRRELANLTAQSAANTPMLLFPYFPAQDDAVELETHVILFSVAGARQNGLEAENNFAQVTFDGLLPSLWEYRDGESLDVFYDKSVLSLPEERSQALEVLLQCYPGASLFASGEYFDVYHFNADTLSQPQCYQSAAPTPVSPQEGVELSSGTPTSLAWDTGGAAASSFIITVERQNPNVYWIEAEDVFQNNGWYMTSEFVTGFSGNGFLVDNWQSGETQYRLNVEEGGEYRVWVRSYKRRINDQHNFVTIHGQTFEIAGYENLIDQWIWEDLGEFTLPAGPLSISLSRTYGQDDQYSVFIDAILVTADLGSLPGENSVWKTAWESDEIHLSASRYTLPEELSPGNYRWTVRVFDGDKLIDFTGARGITMPYATFTILP
jgi:4-amino-4-deoxy-L-arabinose transferase-like glycosyltransferase